MKAVERWEHPLLLKVCALSSLVDLFLRWNDRAWLHSSLGAFPPLTLFQNAWVSSISPYVALSNPSVLTPLMLGHAGILLILLLKKTAPRILIVFAFALQVSLVASQSPAAYGFDMFLLLFWMAACLQSFRRKWGAVFLAASVLAAYASIGFYKTNPHWLHGKALDILIQNEFETTPFAKTLLGNPVLALASVLTPFLELLLPLLFFFYTKAKDLARWALVGFHLSTMLLFSIGPFALMMSLFWATWKSPSVKSRPTPALIAVFLCLLVVDPAARAIQVVRNAHRLERDLFLQPTWRFFSSRNKRADTTRITIVGRTKDQQEINLLRPDLPAEDTRTWDLPSQRWRVVMIHHSHNARHRPMEIASSTLDWFCRNHSNLQEVAILLFRRADLSQGFQKKTLFRISCQASQPPNGSPSHSASHSEPPSQPIHPDRMKLRGSRLSPPLS